MADSSSSDGVFSLHHSDHPNLVLVSKKLNGDNYTSWARGMQLSLSAKNKLGFITGDIQEPSFSDDPDAHAAWRRCNDMILSWLLHSLELDLQESVLFSTSVQAVWDDLRERFYQSNAPRIFQLNRELATISQGFSSISAYFTRLKALWDELASYNDGCTSSCNAKHDRQQLIPPRQPRFSASRPHNFTQAHHVQGTQAPASSSTPATHQVPRFSASRPHNFTQAHHVQGTQAPASSSAPATHQVHGAQPTLHDLQLAMPDLSAEQHSRVLAALRDTTTPPQANAVLTTDFAQRLGFEGDDWCG
ncbi:S2-RNase [Pyrus ussuriensis x Pyrus communis]|uniref:S2-RNase n=1 Tax=Pyrus ussuriensis x Pyrus communis TaxID=2448454 RepID=A0A5N5HYM0_9ROSA|nr:S2-RNase [Pyrus ussuriensis x Pyrus communis]KAB2631943.1 S2-RNase [Pyrus ussuriensis x Pyrus communis]